ncbi:hemicentin-1-like isoform X2 [Ruditapes philippinarum]|uniref:hemicentin-1-like isoform X2 n=1 Tax=Ruditapes philippinarum TaxID=129788 RepID=UPI00295B45E6|nr:hemicentin-1-like isoform X2 [Ruditapes philippinarum]
MAAFNKIQLIAILCSITGSSGLLCYSCNDIRTSEDCMNAVECTGREECFTRADGFINGSVLYTAGCTYDMVPVGQRSQTFCSEVCNEDLCNLDNCQLPVSPRGNISRPPRCLSCDLIDDPAQCKNLVQCQSDEMCFIRKVVIYGNTRYRLGCMNLQHCSAAPKQSSPSPAFVGKRSDGTDSSCSLCCSEDHCNFKSCGSQRISVSDDHIYDLHLLRDERTCIDFNPTACAAFGSLNKEACKAIADVDNLCPASCGMCGHYGWSEWGEWSVCSQSCDDGTSVRYRICIHQLDAASNQTCVGTGNEMRNCSIEPCAVNGQWSDWSEWGNCSVTCENGTHTRHRQCINPAPQHGGMNCTGNDLEIEECSEQPCPVDGEWCWKNVYKCSYTSHYNGYRIDGSGYERTSCGCPSPSNGGKTCS